MSALTSTDYLKLKVSVLIKLCVVDGSNDAEKVWLKFGLGMEGPEMGGRDPWEVIS